MANYNKSFNFKNGLQVDDDNFIINSNGLVGIGTTIPTQILDVGGNVRVSGELNVVNINATNIQASGISTFNIVNVGITSITSGIITAISGIITYYGDGSKLINIPASQWLLSSSKLYTTLNVGIGTTNPVFNFQVGSNPLIYSTGIGINSSGNVYSNGIVTAVSFSGSGSNLFSLNASNISSGTISTAYFPQNIGVSGTITASNFIGSFSGTATTALNLSPTNIITANRLNVGLASVGVATVGIVTVTNAIHLIGNNSKIGIGTTNSQVRLDIIGGSRFGGVLERVSAATTYLSGSRLVLELDCQQSTTYTYTIPTAANIGIVSFKNMLSQSGIPNGTTITVLFTQNALGTGNTTASTGIGTNITIIGYENGVPIAGVSKRALVANENPVTLSVRGGDVDFVSFFIYYNGSLNTSPFSYDVYATKNGNFR